MLANLLILGREVTKLYIHNHIGHDLSPLRKDHWILECHKPLVLQDSTRNDNIVHLFWLIIILNMYLWYPYVNLFMKLWKCTFECLDIYNKIDGKLLNSDTSAVERSLIKTIILKKDRLEHYLLPMGWKLYSKPAYPHVENVRGFRFHQ